MLRNALLGITGIAAIIGAAAVPLLAGTPANAQAAKEDAAPVAVHPLPRGEVPPYMPPKLIAAADLRGSAPDVMVPPKKKKKPKTPALYETIEPGAADGDGIGAGDLPPADNAPIGGVAEEALSDPAVE